MTTARYGAAPATAALSDAPRGRAAGWWGWIFVLLLLGSAGMASVPGGTAATSTVRDFYTANTDVIVVAQIVGLVAALTFLPFTIALRRGPVRRGAPPDLEAAGAILVGASILTAVPVLWLTAVAGNASDAMVHGLAVTCDLTDVALFSAIALWSWTLVGASSPLWFRMLAGVVAVLSLARAGLLLVRSPDLEQVAPVAFVVLVVVLSTAVLFRHSPVPPR